MLFVSYSKDKEGSSALRVANRADHLAYMALHEERILIGGPARSNVDTQPDGTFLIVDFPDVDAVNRFLDKDPYARAGLFAERTVSAFQPTRIDIDALSSAVKE